MSIEDLYRERYERDSDIKEHMPRLRELAAQCQNVTEFGVHMGNSTVALLAGQPDTLDSYDCTRIQEVIDEISPQAGRTRFLFRGENTLECDIAPTDMLFIDTVHTAKQVYHELTRHAGKVRKWLVFHDTVLCGESDDYYTEKPAGLLYGIGRYMYEHPGEWRLLAHYEDYNGLTVYERL